MGGEGSVVETDETFIGNRKVSPRTPSCRLENFQNAVLTLVERGGEARSFHIDGSDYRRH